MCTVHAYFSFVFLFFSFFAARLAASASTAPIASSSSNRTSARVLEIFVEKPNARTAACNETRVCMCFVCVLVREIVFREARERACVSHVSHMGLCLYYRQPSRLPSLCYAQQRGLTRVFETIVSTLSVRPNLNEIIPTIPLSQN